MEKYYLGQLDDGADLERKIKFVEVQYARRAPSLGLVYLSKLEAGHELHLASLELGTQNEAKFGVLNRIKLSNLTSVLDFDTLGWVETEPGPLACISLARDSSSGQVGLYDVPLTSSPSGSPKRMHLPPNSVNNLQRVTRCQLKQAPPEEGDEVSRERTIHLLADRCYQSFHVHQGNELEVAQSYSINSAGNYAKFVNFSVLETNQNLALLELSDASLRVVHKSQCLASFSLVDQLGSVQRHLLLSGASKHEALLVSASQNNLIGHSIQMNEESPGRREDPDNLLPSEPSFELDQCWSLDLNDLDSIRASGDSLPNKQWACSLCSMRPPDEQSSSFPKFLLVGHQFHLLVYSFEQYNTNQSLPFSIVYDRSFLAQTQQTDAEPKSKQNYIIEPKLRPKLVHNFKMIGPQPTDALFNTLFQARGDRLDQLRHFDHLRLLASLSQTGHLFGFKLSSPKLVQQKDNLYQQLVCDSIRGSSRLLLDQVESQQEKLAKLRAGLAHLESTPNNTSPENNEQQDLNKLLQAQLRQRQDIGGLYNLQLSVSSVVQVAQILVVSTASSYILKPLNQDHISQIHIDNELNKPTRDKPILLSLSSSNPDEDERKTLLDERPIESCAIIDLDCNFKSVELSLPIFLMDGRFGGQLKVFYILQPGHIHQEDQLQKLPVSMASILQHQAGDDLVAEREASSEPVRYHSTTLAIKPLLSYQIPANESRPLGEHQELSYQLRGPVKAKLLAGWLQDCVTTAPTTTTGRLTSPFTHCTLGFDLRDGELGLASDDMFALELIKCHVLKEATNQGIKLEVKQVPSSPTTGHLRRLVELQTINFGAARRLREQLELAQGKTNDKQRGKQTELLLESLMSQVGLNSPPCPTQPKPPPSDWVEDSFRDDVAQLVKSQELVLGQMDADWDFGQQREECEVFTDLICGFIIDILVDFDRMFGGGGGGSQRASADRMIRMRTKILKIISQFDAAKTPSVVAAIMLDWCE